MARTKANRLSLALQMATMKNAYPRGSGRIHRSELVWRGEFTPSELSCTYLVEVRYKLRESPEIRVLSPPLQSRGDQRPPHLYRGEKLCLYLPNKGEWDGKMRLADTILPWISEWLLNYELWLVTGTWHGGGAHPPNQ